jgi:hypothetical protein
LPEWEEVLSAAARLQQIVPGAVLVGTRFDRVLAQLESVAGWKTARTAPPVQILGSLDGIETGVRQLIREVPLETRVVVVGSDEITVPTEAEILRIKAALILKRNAVRDYLDFVALAHHLGNPQVADALSRFDSLYPQPSGESALQQLQSQLANAMPFDLDTLGDLSEYKDLASEWHDWSRVRAECANLATMLFEAV